MIRRILLIFPTLFILTTIVFLTVRLIPGDAIDAMELRLQAAGEIDRDEIERMLGLDKPIHTQYGNWISGILFQGTFGESMFFDPVAIEQRILQRMPVTFELGVMAIGIGLLIAMPVGIYSAMRQDTAADYSGRTLAVIGMAHSQLLAGNDGRDIPGDLVGLVATDGIRSIHTRPVGQYRDTHHSQPGFGDRHVGKYHAVDAHNDAGGTQAGLYQDRPVQGSQ